MRHRPHKKTNIIMTIDSDMERTVKQIFFLCALLLAAIPLMARDFDAVTPSGHTLYCDVVTGGVEIVGWDYDYSSQGNEPIRLTIPSLVSNGGADMRVVAIGEGAFRGCFRMVSVEIPSSVRRIGRKAFSYCYGLGGFSIPASVDSIGQDAFLRVPVVEYSGTAQGAPWGASCLHAYHEGHYYFADSQRTHLICCEKDATDATIPPTVTSIGEGAFASCYNITSVRIDSTVCDVEDNAFINCTGLEEVYYNQNTDIGDRGRTIFSECIHLKQLVFGNAVTIISYGFCYGCTSLKTVVVPDNITNVFSDAFINCTSLESAVLGSGLSWVGVSMFEGCTSLREVTMSENIQAIGLRSFLGCSSLREIILPKKLSYIAGDAYYGCSSVARIVCMNDSVPETKTGAFYDVDSAAEVIVPCGKESLYGQDAVWQRFSNIKGQSYYMVATTNNPLWGKAIVTQQPTCDDSSAVIEAIPEEGCRFVKWDDDNTDNPRQLSFSGVGKLRREALFESTTGISAPGALSNVKVYYSHGNIVVEGAQGEQVWLFDVMGRMLLSAKAASASFSIARTCIPASGVYLVKIGSRKTEKVVVM